MFLFTVESLKQKPAPKCRELGAFWVSWQLYQVGKAAQASQLPAMTFGRTSYLKSFHLCFKIPNTLCLRSVLPTSKLSVSLESLIFLHAVSIAELLLSATSVTPPQAAGLLSPPGCGQPALQAPGEQRARGQQLRLGRDLRGTRYRGPGARLGGDGGVPESQLG